MSVRAAASCCALAALSAAAIAAATPLSRAQAVSTSPLLVVSSDVHTSGSRELLLLDSLGHERRRLTRHEPQGAWPAWSPDGRTIAFVGVHKSTSSAFETEGLWIVPASGGSPRRLFRKRRTLGPAWSPDGKRLLFTVDDVLWVIDRDGRRAGRISPRSLDVLRAAWSPNGRMIAVSEYRGGKLGGGLSVARSDGSGWRRITRPASRQRIADENDVIFDPVWSPDGRQVAFSRGFVGEGPAPLLEVAAASGKREQVIGHGIEPHWSADSETIAFVNVVGSRAPNRVTLIRPDGTARRTLADVPGQEFALTWARDGTAVVVATGDGTSLRRWEVGVRGMPPRRLRPARVRAFGGLVGNDLWSATGDLAVDYGRLTAPFDRNAENRYEFLIDIVPLRGTRRPLLQPASDSEPTWSPDGARVAFARRIGMRTRIYTMLASGHGTHALAAGTSPLWAPDGKYIAFQHGAAIGVVRPDGTGARTLTVDGSSPAWSPDGQSLVFVRDGGVWVVDVDNGGSRPLIANVPAHDSDDPAERCTPTARSPRWSPDGNTIAFIATCRSFDGVLVVGSDGGAPRTIFELEFEGDELVWSPDGRFLALSSSSGDMAVITAAGVEQRRDYSSRTPAWSRDGGTVAFVVDRLRATDIWTMAPDGSNERRLTTRGFNDEPDWQP